MLDLIYDLQPDEDVTEIDGHLLVLAAGPDMLSGLLGAHCLRKLERLDDMSEFQMAFVSAALYPHLIEAASELPALLHFRDGVERARLTDIDDCLEYLDEFIINNSRSIALPTL